MWRNFEAFEKLMLKNIRKLMAERVARAQSSQRTGTISSQTSKETSKETKDLQSFQQILQVSFGVHVHSQKTR